MDEITKAIKEKLAEEELYSSNKIFMFFARCEARVIDILLLEALIFALFFLVGILRGNEGIWIPSIGMNYFVHSIVFIAYSAWFVSSKWQATLGKRLVGIYVASDKHIPLSFLHSLVRECVSFSASCCVVNALSTEWRAWARRRDKYVYICEFRDGYYGTTNSTPP